MGTEHREESGLKNLLAGVRRKPIGVSQASLINAEPLKAEGLLPLVISPAIEGVNLVLWATSQREFIEAHLRKHGAILFRNFGVKSLIEFEAFIGAISAEMLEYTYRSTPRSQVQGKIYTSTEYPADQAIPLHNEMSYASSWPMKIWFWCAQAAQEGGETPIADSRKVFERIAPEIRERFLQKKVMYVRNYGEGLDLTWQNVFQTADRSVVEAYCRSAGIDFEWKSGDRLRTRQICQAVAAHPQTGEMVWFNQAHLFHVSSLPAPVREVLLAEFDEEDLPRNSYYGDGSPLEPSVLDEIREAYNQESIVFPWQEGDVLMLDNMLVAHGRRPFVGPRQVLVGMAESVVEKD